MHAGTAHRQPSRSKIGSRCRGPSLPLGRRVAQKPLEALPRWRASRSERADRGPEDASTEAGPWKSTFASQPRAHICPCSSGGGTSVPSAGGGSSGSPGSPASNEGEEHPGLARGEGEALPHIVRERPETPSAGEAKVGDEAEEPPRLEVDPLKRTHRRPQAPVGLERIGVVGVGPEPLHRVGQRLGDGLPPRDRNRAGRRSTHQRRSRGGGGRLSLRDGGGRREPLTSAAPHAGSRSPPGPPEKRLSHRAHRSRSTPPRGHARLEPPRGIAL